MLITAIVLISHQTPEEVAVMAEFWQSLNPAALIHIAYGGPQERFQKLSWPHRTFIDDPRLKTKDHQRERQSYRGLMGAVWRDLKGKGVQRILLAECDVVPLRAGLLDYLEKRRLQEDADMMGPRLRRVDGTGHPHFLAHQSHPAFERWMAQSIRPDNGVVLMMIGCLSWWTWEAFAATAEAEEPLPVYLELAMPTTAHQLGYRVRELTELNDFLMPLGEVEPRLEEWRAAGEWVAHPCKKIWKNQILI